MVIAHDLYLNGDKSHASLLPLIDLYAAFNLVDHASLLRCLKAKEDIRGCTLN